MHPLSRIALASLAALFTPLIAAPALAARPVLHVKESIVIAAPPAQVWAAAGDFGNLGWHPAVASTTVDQGENNRPGAVRTVTTKDGAKLVERLVARDDAARRLSYTIIDSPLPVSDYRSTLRVLPDEAGSRVEWSSRFRRKAEKPLDGADDAGARRVIHSIYSGGLGNLKATLEAH